MIKGILNKIIHASVLFEFIQLVKMRQKAQHASETIQFSCMDKRKETREYISDDAKSKIKDLNGK